MVKLTKMEKAIKTLKDDDYVALQHIYLYRTLTITQLMKSVYHLKDNQTRRRNAIMKRLLDLDVVSLEDYKSEEHAVNLTTTGINIVRQTKDIPQEIFDDKLKVVKRGYYTAAELKMKKNLLNHQLTKNNFMLKFQNLIAKPEFKDLMDQSHIQFKYQYFDEKYLTTYRMMRPDSVLHVANTDYFIEEDMATESAQQLKDKWKHYREFMATSEFNMKENDIVVLFLTDNIVREKSLRRREELVRLTAMQVLGDKFTNHFDMIIGSQNEILQIMPKLILQAYHVDPDILNLYQVLGKQGWKFTDTDFLSRQLNHENYLAYMIQLDSKGQLLTVHYRDREFILDDYRLRPVAVMHRIYWLNHNSIIFHNMFKRHLQYIVIVNSDQETSLIKDLKSINCLIQTNLFFTTLKRIETLPLKDALFRFDQSGQRYHFSNEELVDRVYEKDDLK